MALHPTMIWEIPHSLNICVLIILTMRTLYIGGQKKKNNSGLKWKIYTFLFLSLVIIGSALKLTGPMIVENWINKKGADTTGYAFSVREVDLSLGKGQMILKDVKVFNPNTSTEMLETPNLTIQLSWLDLFSQGKKVLVSADKVDLILSKDLSSEMERIQAAGEKKDLYLATVDGKISKLNIIEQKEDQSRTVLELNDVNIKVKEVSLLSINKKTEFSVSSNIDNGGKLNLTGKTSEENGRTPWSIHGSLKQVSADIFNKIAGDKLPFSFHESRLNAEISAHSDHGKVSGEIAPDIKVLNLLDERPGIPTQSIARALTEELTFTLPFTLKDALTVQYEDTFRKLKTYRKYPASIVSSGTTEVKESQTQTPKSKKSFSFWPF